MHIYVDADACPRPIKEVLFKAAVRTKTQMTLVANQYLQTPRSNLINILVVGAGFDVADHKIVELAEAGDLVITSDITLAAASIDEGAMALNPRGYLYEEANIKEKLSVHNLMEEFRASAVEVGGGPPPFNNKDVHSFSNQLDRILTKK